MKMLTNLYELIKDEIDKDYEIDLLTEEKY